MRPPRVVGAGPAIVAGICAGLWVAFSGAARGRDGFFTTGQPADLLISGYGFNKTGGPLRFNHPSGIAFVEGRLVLADRNHNRVLVWSGAPQSGDEPPALVLGQESVETNAPGSALDALNWPTAVASDGTRLYVADAYNDRVLVWRAAPARSKQPADFALTASSGVRWPWGIWTDGRRLMVSATFGGRVLVWERIPESDMAPDRVLRIEEFGTPRTIESDGRGLLVSDHNARVNNSAGNFFWRTFPASDAQPFDFFIASPASGQPPPGPAPAQAHGEHIHDALALGDGRFLALFNRSLCIWASFPQSATEPCAVLVGNQGGSPGGRAGFDVDAGDNSGLAVHDGRLFVSMNNGNRLVVFSEVPTERAAMPAFAIGSPDVGTNTLATDGIVTNGVPLTDGRRLWVSSDYDRRLYIWRELPAADGRKPDVAQALDFAPWAAARFDDGIVLAGGNTVAIWQTPPDGQAPEVVVRVPAGDTNIGDLRGVAWDGTYFYLAGLDRNRVWAWRGVPAALTAPAIEIAIEQPGRISSDGRYLAVTHAGPTSGVTLYDVAQLSAGGAPVEVDRRLRMNLPQGATLAGGALFIADTNGNRVLVWRDAADAYAGRDPDAVLGATDLLPRPPAIGQATMFWPGAVAYDGTFLWVGEFKFSNRILRFTRP